MSAPSPGLKRELGLLEATMMAMGSTICAGVFTLLGPAYRIAGPAVVLSFLFAGIINSCTMFSYCELAAAMPKMGGEYVYVKEAFDGIAAFVTGWFEWSSNIFYAALMALGSAVLVSAFTQIPSFVAAVVVAVIFAALNVKGIKESGTVESLLALILLGILSLLVGAGLVHGVEPETFNSIMAKGWPSILVVMALIFETYVGVEAVAATQAEIKQPEKTIPRAIVVSSVALIVLYCLIAYVTVGIVPKEILSEFSAPLTFLAEKLMGSVGGILLTAAGLIAALTSLNAATIAYSRAACAMSHDRYFPECLGRIHDCFRTPHIAVMSGSIIVAALSITGSIEFIAYLVSFGFIVGFSLVNLSLIKLRWSQPHLKRPYKVPLYPLTPVLGIISSLLLLAFFQIDTLIVGIAWSLLGLLIYFLRPRRKQVCRASTSAQAP